MNKKVLIACEESQAVCIEFRKLGIEAYSCDILNCSGGHPEWHIQGNVLDQLNKGWHMMIAFPPCTHLAASGAKHFEQKRKDGRQQQGIDFFMQLVNAPIEMIALENPIGIMSSVYKKPDQIIQPYYFGEPYTKSTCLWLKNLPKLTYSLDTANINKGEFFEWIDKKTGKLKRQPLWYYHALKDKTNRAKIRSKTFKGIAKAMATQWAKTLINT